MPNSQQPEQKTANLHQGFHDSVHDSQQVFRQLLKAMSEPGTIQHTNFLENVSMSIDNGFYQTSYATALSLLDGNCKVGLSAQLDDLITRNSLSFHCACSLVDISDEHDESNESVTSKIDFLFLNAQEWQRLLTHPSLSVGDLSYPEKSTTIIVQVAAIEQTAMTSNSSEQTGLVLMGPGIEHQRHLFIEGFTDTLLSSLQQNQTLFPLGYDFILTAPDALVALPRTCRIELISDDHNKR